MVISSLNDSHFEVHVAETQTNYMGGSTLKMIFSTFMESLKCVASFMESEKHK